MSKRTVVILELEPQLADGYELFLAARGFLVTAASSPGTAMREVASRPPDVVVIGNVPDTIDAGTVAARLRALVAPRPIGIVVLAATMDEIAAADLVVPRGAHPRAVMDAIRTVLRRRPITAPIATVS